MRRPGRSRQPGHRMDVRTVRPPVPDAQDAPRIRTRVASVASARRLGCSNSVRKRCWAAPRRGTRRMKCGRGRRAREILDVAWRSRQAAPGRATSRHVIRDLDKLASPVLLLDIHPCRPGVQRVLHQFLHHRRRTLHDLPGRNLAGDLRRQDRDGCARGGSCERSAHAVRAFKNLLCVFQASSFDPWSSARGQCRSYASRPSLSALAMV